MGVVDLHTEENAEHWMSDIWNFKCADTQWVWLFQNLWKRLV